MNNKNNLVTIVDQIGRVLLGKVVKSDNNTLTLNNPAIIHIGQNPQTGQIQVQTIPYFFKEFIDASQQEKGSNFTFKRANIVEGEVELDERLKTQYERLFSAAPVVAPATNKKVGAEVVKLFDDEDDKK